MKKSLIALSTVGALTMGANINASDTKHGYYGGYNNSKVQANIGDYIWHDQNKNGVQDTYEKGIPGVSVKVLECYSYKDVGYGKTNYNGQYKISGIKPGSYRVAAKIDTSKYNITYKNKAHKKKDSNATSIYNGYAVTDCFTINNYYNNPYRSIKHIDIGFIQKYTKPTYQVQPIHIGDKVFWDKNKNYKYDNGDYGIGYATIKLKDKYGKVVTTTTSDYSGYYKFMVNPGCYKVEVTLPSSIYGTFASSNVSKTWCGKSGQKNLAIDFPIWEKQVCKYEILPEREITYHDLGLNAYSYYGSSGTVDLSKKWGLSYGTVTLNYNQVQTKYGLSIFKGGYPKFTFNTKGYVKAWHNQHLDAHEKEGIQAIDSTKFMWVGKSLPYGIRAYNNHTSRPYVYNSTYRKLSAYAPFTWKSADKTYGVSFWSTGYANYGLSFAPYVEVCK